MSVEEICKKFGIENYTINSDGSIDVDGDVFIYDKGVTELPLKFGSVTGYFYCPFNQLTSLSGSPKSVGGDFRCYDNKLTDLKGSPESVGGGFYCYDNQLTDLKGSPKSVGGNFYCCNNQLTTLSGSPKSVGGDFDYSDNKLTSLEGSPESVGGDFYCYNNPISSISTKMDKDFIRSFNTFKVLNDGIVNLKRLKYVMEMFDLPIYIADIKKYYTIK